MTLQWLLPIGFLSLLGIGILILIYIIKPSYRKRLISSSYAWQRVLKRKKELPIDRFRNIFLFLLQALILAACGMIFARPNILSKDILDDTVERIIILDASAGMRAHAAGDPQGLTRFDRAVNEVRVALDEVVMVQDGLVSVILADSEPDFYLDRVDRSEYSDAIMALEGLSCTPGHADMNAALQLAKERMYNSSTEIYIYTGTQLGDIGEGVNVVNLADIGREWNVSVLGCDVITEGNEFVFNIELGAYGRVSSKKEMKVLIKGADIGTGAPVDLNEMTVPVTFDVNSDSLGYEQRQTIEVKATDENIGGRPDFYFSSFKEAIITIPGLNDSIADDDTLTVFGGEKDVINIQYSSSERNIFYYLGFNNLRDNLRDMRDITFYQLDVGADPAVKGFDIYIFEHIIPDEVLAYGLPTDGITIIADPDRSIDNLGVQLGEKVTFSTLETLSAGEEHPLTAYIKPDRNGLTQYTKITEYEDDYVPLLYCGDDPVLLAKNTPSSKVVVIPFSLNLSDFISWDFQTFLYNIIQYYFPLTVTQYNFEYGDTAVLNCKGESLVIANDKNSYVIRGFPAELKLDELGVFTFTVRSGLERPDEVRKIMVRIPHSESAIFAVSDVRVVLDRSEIIAKAIHDIFPYIAILIIALLFVEWWLQFKSEA